MITTYEYSYATIRPGGTLYRRINEIKSEENASVDETMAMIAKSIKRINSDFLLKDKVFLKKIVKRSKSCEW
jgi:hypothetical protein